MWRVWCCVLQEREERVGPKDMGGVANGGTGAAKSQERREQRAVGNEEEEACLSDHSEIKF
jgi:hypothetical protein